MYYCSRKHDRESLLSAPASIPILPLTTHRKPGIYVDAQMVIWILPHQSSQSQFDRHSRVIVRLHVPDFGSHCHGRTEFRERVQILAVLAPALAPVLAHLLLEIVAVNYFVWSPQEEILENELTSSHGRCSAEDLWPGWESSM